MKGCNENSGMAIQRCLQDGCEALCELRIFTANDEAAWDCPMHGIQIVIDVKRLNGAKKIARALRLLK